MKKLLFVAILAAGSLIACNDTSGTNNGVDTSSQTYKDSVANAAGGSMNTTPTDTSSSMMTTPTDTSSTMMSDTSSTMMKSDSTPK